MKKSSLLACAALTGVLFSGLSIASATEKTPKAELPRPIVVVAPQDVPQRFSNTTVSVGMTLDEKGCPTDIRVIAPNSAYLEKSIVPAIAQWRFTPMVKNGVPVSQEVVLPLTLKAPPM